MFVPDSRYCWLTPPEQEEVISMCLRAGLIRSSNAHDLPLKSGGTTDIYVNLRQMRNSPEALAFLARAYADPLRRLRAQRVIEVPEAVSPLAGVISVETGLPLVTIRESAKAGRVQSGTVIGELGYGQRVVLIDDVVTDGASKIVPIQTALALGADVAAMVVLVDRQQGWRKKLAAAGLGHVPVWPGMTLHDVRKYLVMRKLMERCNPETEAKNPIILALDGKDWEDMLPLLDMFRTQGPILKVNDLLFFKGMEHLLADLAVYGRVMADVKAFDIPDTVSRIMRRTAHCPPWAITVHASGGREMLAAAVKMTREAGTKILAVTVLTSMKNDCEEVYTRQPLDQVMRLAEIAASEDVGVDGFVCSAEEVAQLRAQYPNKLLVVPGVRPQGANVGDQKRVGTPAEIMGNGANHLVIGRPIFEAKDPVAEHGRILKEELGIS